METIYTLLGDDCMVICLELSRGLCGMIRSEI